MPYPAIDPKQLRVFPLSQRRNLLRIVDEADKALSIIETYHIPTGTLPIEHPHKHYSVLASAYRHLTALTVHPGIGYDIITNHPLYHGGAIGRAAATMAGAGFHH